MNYLNFTYPQLKKECAARNLGGAGKGPELIAKLVAADLVHQSEFKPVPLETAPQMPEITPEQDPPRKPKIFSNWDEDGKWIRRPKGFISWEEEERKAG